MGSGSALGTICRDLDHVRGVRGCCWSLLHPRGCTRTIWSQVMRTAFENLIEFERACGHRLSIGPPAIPDGKTRQLRRDLIREEQEELDAAIVAGDLEEIADALGDLIYVCLGTAVRFGIDIVPVWNAIQKANMTKVGPGSTRGPNGKLLKPPGFEHPDIGAILDAQLPLAELYQQDEKESAA